MATVKDMTNIARRMVNSVDAATATIETESAKLRDDFTRSSDMLDMTEFVSEESMTRCMGMVEERAKHALRIFTDYLKTPAGRTAAANYGAQSRRDAVRSPATRTRGGPFGFDSTTPTPAMTIDVSKILLDASRVRYGALVLSVPPRCRMCV